ncbi:NAD(P)-binding protein [Coprinopsis marcescibilis]|uniref:NAD(P)-binding protein n=1 Tax=Coprinopsis marcescibilis TaxID=230819 RepID=A0A5C3KED9_COPMA|nr:NAD(P)-binding protein [Coprinopsis marcescibilis]
MSPSRLCTPKFAPSRLCPCCYQAPNASRYQTHLHRLLQTYRQQRRPQPLSTVHQFRTGGRSVINIFGECEDSLLATPLILDLSILAELLTRVKYHKAPLVKPGIEVINSLNRQCDTLEAFLKACLGLEGGSDLLLETSIW